jgi:hypothetical protein
MSGAPVLMPLRRRLEVSAFGINCWTAPVGAPVIERHSEPDGDEEVYLVVRGRVRSSVSPMPGSPPTTPPRSKRSLETQMPPSSISPARLRWVRLGCGSSQQVARTSPCFARTHAGNS